MNGLASARVLRRAAPRQVVLVHGLFCHGGFWLPWLERFPDLQLTVLTIDYAALFAAGVGLEALGAEIDRLAGAKPAHVVAHSFGCWAALFARRPFLSRAFVCPTFAAEDFDAAAFGAEIARRSDAAADAVALQVRAAVGIKQAHADAAARGRPGDRVFLPRDDPYFTYAAQRVQGEVRACGGGHFEIGEAMDAIARAIAATP
jgi:hypothetical protein